MKRLLIALGIAVSLLLIPLASDAATDCQTRDGSVWSNSVKCRPPK